MDQTVPGKGLPTSQRDAMYAERIRMLMGHPLYIIVGAHLFSVAVLVVGLQALNPDPLVPYWGALLVLITVLRGAAILQWRRSGVPDSRSRSIGRAFTLLALIAGLGWTSGAILFFDPANLPAVALICLVLIGMATGGMGPLAAYFPAYAAFATAALLPFSLSMFFHDVAWGWFVGIAGIFYSACCLAAAAYLTSRIREAFELRYENRHLIATLEAKRREAERASEAKGRFLAAASHDLRQPLNALSLAVDMLDTVSEGAERRELVRSIRSSVDATNDLLTGLLDVSRLDAGVVRPEPRVIALAPLFDQVAEMFDPVALDRDVTLRVRRTPARIHSDPALLGSILQNLVGNAIRYVQRGGCVLVVARRRGPHWRIEIRDNGPGIPADQQQRIFEDFTRCHPAGDGTGLGLGLAIVRRVTRLLGHELQVQSRPGHGSIFGVEVLAAAETLADTRTGGASRTSEALPVPVLLLAPDAAARGHLRSGLQARGMQVSATASLAEASERLQSGIIVPRVLVVDGHEHGEFDGIDAIRWMVGHWRQDLPAILMTGDPSSNLRRRARAAGIKLLRKPVPGDCLAKTIADLLPRPA